MNAKTRTEQAADMLESIGQTSAATVLRETAVKLEADARALWSVRVLDAWAEKNPPIGYRVAPMCETVRKGSRYGSRVIGYVCVLGAGTHSHYGPTPDAARIAAATSLVASDPSLEPK